MNDQPTDEHGTDGPATDDAQDSVLTSEQEQAVRRLLVDARELEPMPDSVVARLDRVLAELAASPDNAPANPPADHPAENPAGHPSGSAPPPDTTAQVTNLVAVRRQRAGRLLLAAAAVVVVGIGVGQVLGLGGGSSGGDSAVTSAESQTDSAGQDEERAQDKALTAPEAAGSEPEVPAFALDRPVRIDPDRFSEDVERARRLAAGGPKESDNLGVTGGSFAAECIAADWGQGTFVPVRYAGDAGVLVFRAPTGDSQVVDLFQCGSAEVLRSITLAAP